MNIISFSLWGDIPKYTIGAIRNAELVSSIYPGWVARFYCGASVPTSIIYALKTADAEVVLMSEQGDNRGMFWRFHSLADTTAEYTIFRDTDSRLNKREVVAVDAWLNSGKVGHIMRDHPQHPHRILGGMWGCRCGVFPNIQDMIREYNPVDAYNQDQLFLEEKIYPILQKKGVLVHDSCTMLDLLPCKFPVDWDGECNFVGEIYDENDVRNEQWKEVAEFRQSKQYKFLFFSRMYRLLKVFSKRQIMKYLPGYYDFLRKLKNFLEGRF